MRTQALKRAAHAAFTLYLRRSPLDRGKQRLLSALWRPLSFGEYEREVTLRLRPVRMKCDVRSHIQRQIYFFGGYEEENCRKWVEFAEGAHVVFDLGANVGVYSLLAASANPRAVIHAFEPTPEVLATLRHNLRLNGFANVVLNCAGVGRFTGTGYLNRYDGEDGSNEGMNFVSGGKRNAATDPVELHALDDYCEARGIDRIDLLKMDIEGGEIDALLGAPGLLRRKAIGCIFLEVLEQTAARTGRTADDLIEILRGASYHLYELDGGRLRPLARGATRRKNDVIAAALPL